MRSTSWRIYASSREAFGTRSTRLVVSEIDSGQSDRTIIVGRAHLSVIPVWVAGGRSGGGEKGASGLPPRLSVAAGSLRQSRRDPAAPSGGVAARLRNDRVRAGLGKGKFLQWTLG